MIEIICRENQQEEQEIKPPKNIRQIGNPRGRHKIYMEDYVYTYLRNQARSVQKSAAVLLGKSCVSKDMRYTFISGAIECGQAVFQFDSIYLDESFWEYIYTESQEYFSDTTIVGWFVGKKGEGLQLTTAIESAHRKYFTGRDKILMLMDAEEDEELFYIYEQGYLQKREGYYIYYEKNIAMQEYMIRKREEVSIDGSEWEKLHEEIHEKTVEEKKEEIFAKSSMEEPLSEAEKALQNYRQSMMEKQGHKVERQNKRFLYTAASFFMIAFCLVGITTINNYRKMKEVEDVLYVMKEEKQEKKEEKSDLVVESVESDVVPLQEEEKQQQVAESQTMQQQVVNQQAIEQQQTSEPQQASEPQYYVVQAGDTLESICLKVYQDKSKVAELCQANGIENGNQIQAGQKLILP
ncbi:LysM peptidoglycan-binding domain-containing protein [Roseburia sp. 499]|uniref:LysM peptidoglycan-binding domain-containing protein n=1 Tax=Roseburia sp. 499 TaxID=1261634 RepID=UPI0009519420|nr:LysM domain-containing protein [Roseburia sp. 499]WVK69586.1 LysM peptidoglycan-binding domain-containing protein [Roseburia sp. 499]